MPIYVELVPSGDTSNPTSGPLLEVEQLSTTFAAPPPGVTVAQVPRIDGCPILQRTKAFVVNQGEVATLEHTFRDRAGNPIDLSAFFPDEANSTSGLDLGYAIKLRAKDWLGIGFNPLRNPVWESVGSVYEPVGGRVRAELPATLVERPGIYELSWAVLNLDGRPININDGLLSVERSLWPADVVNLLTAKGPPTLNEIRMLLMDASANENTLLADIEFKDEQIMLALTKPVQYWNEALPPILPFTTRDFPFRGAWATGTLGQLHIIAANHYRRNLLRHAAGGQEVADKDKEREYLAEGQRLWKTYTDWASDKKVSLNLKRFFGVSVSAYSTHTGW